jgi:hypothetical protein
VFEYSGPKMLRSARSSHSLVEIVTNDRIDTRDDVV